MLTKMEEMLREWGEKWAKQQQQEFAYEEVQRRYDAQLRALAEAEAKAAEDAYRRELADVIARRVIELLKEDEWITRPSTPKTVWIQQER